MLYGICKFLSYVLNVVVVRFKCQRVQSVMCVTCCICMHVTGLTCMLYGNCGFLNYILNMVVVRSKCL